ncbi:MAG: glycoside hydrolase family 32 protein [Candidatus Poribacteria bacterium]|nr:glycoside hydrolase family 32 protein [Candidatus Poribacteria bacterium]
MATVDELRQRIERESVLERQERLAVASNDPNRPKYHLLPSRPGWLNDPNGPIQINGEYHLFYQYNPDMPYHGDIHWAHVVSDDMAHWEELPIGIAPTPGGADKNGVWTGCAVNNNGVPTILYTGVSPEVQMIATGDATLRTITKREQPAIAAPPKGLALTGFRDPCVWKERDGWYMLIGAGIKDAGGTSLLYRSDDLIEWQYVHLFYEPDAARGVHECPDFFPLGDRHMLLTAWHGSHYDIGDYTADHRFVSDTHGLIDHGNFYAPKTFEDEQGRRIIWGWIQETRSQEEQIRAGWSGVMSLPRVLSMSSDGKPESRFAPELHSLRRTGRTFEKVTLDPMNNLGSRTLKDVEGDTLEIVAEFDTGMADSVGIVLLGDVTIAYDRKKATFAGAPFKLGAKETLRIHLYVDRSVIEVIANDRVAVTMRHYSDESAQHPVRLFATAGKSVAKQVQTWEMEHVNP